MVLMNFATWVMQVLWLYFLGRAGLNSIQLGNYQGDFFSFVIMGIIFEEFSSASVYSFRSALYHEQVEGTLEMALVSSTSLSTYAIGQGIWAFCKAGIGGFIYLITSILLGIKIKISLWSLISLLPFFLVSITSMMGLGIASSGIIIITKQGDPLMFVITWANRLLTGVYYPVSILPLYLQLFSKIFPLTYALDGLRLIALNGYTLLHPQVLRDFVILSLFSVILIPIGIMFFKLGLKKAKKDGTLSFF